jgi:hypothetical protein
MRNTLSFFGAAVL